MSRIRSRDTKPELLIRSLLHRAGFRFRLHRKDLPGRPDIVLPKWRAVIDVRGCYWHAHGCHLFQKPQQNSEFWRSKLQANVDRDLRNALALERLGWRHLVIWECALRGKNKLGLDALDRTITEWIHSDRYLGEFPYVNVRS